MNDQKRDAAAENYREENFTGKGRHIGPIEVREGFKTGWDLGQADLLERMAAECDADLDMSDEQHGTIRQFLQRYRKEK